LFYNSNYLENKFYSFDSDGNFIEEILIKDKLKGNLQNKYSRILFKYKDNLYMVDSETRMCMVDSREYSSSRLLKFI
jgi:hypothetical protein